MVPNITGRPMSRASWRSWSRKARWRGPLDVSGAIWKMPESASASTDAMRATSCQSATRLATGTSPGAVWVGEREVEKPMAPARSASPTSARMRPMSSSVAFWSMARRPITNMRSAEWPI
jgi:hypothetical protein